MAALHRSPVSHPRSRRHAAPCRSTHRARASLLALCCVWSSCLCVAATAGARGLLHDIDNPLWPPVQWMNTSAVPTAGARVLGYPRTSVPAQFTLTQGGDDQGNSSVTFHVTATGTATCLTLAVHAAVPSAVSVRLGPGLPESPALAGYSFTRTGWRTSASQPTAALFTLPWFSGRDNTTVRVQYSRNDTARVDVYPCFRLTSPANVAPGSPINAELITSAAPSGATNGAALVPASAVTLTKAKCGGTCNKVVLTAASRCSCSHYVSRDDLAREGGLAVFDADGSAISQPTQWNLAWPKFVTLGAEQLPGATIVLQTTCCGRDRYRLGVSAEWIEIVDDSTSVADDVSLVLLWPVKTGVIMVGTSVAMLIVGCAKAAHENKEENELEDCAKLTCAAGLVLIAVGIVIIALLALLAAVVFVTAAVTAIVLLSWLAAACSTRILAAELALSQATSKPQTSPSKQSRCRACDPVLWARVARVCVRVVVVIARSVTRIGFDIMWVSMLSSLVSQSYHTPEVGWNPIPQALRAPFTSAAHAVAGTVLAAVSAIDFVTPTLLDASEYLDALTELNCTGPSSTAFAAVGAATSATLLYFLYSDLFLMLAAQGCGVSQTPASTFVRQLPAGLLSLVMAMATTFTISVTTAADSIFTLPFTSEPACAEDWDPVLSIIGRGLGLVSVAAAALAGIVFVLMSHASLRAALQEPLTWALGCGSTSGEGEDNMVHPLAHIQLLFGIWGETAEGTFHLPQRFNAYYLHNTSGDVSPKQRLGVGKALARAVGRTFSLAVLCVPWAAPVAIMYANANTEPLFLDGCSFHNSRTRCQRVLEVGAWASSTTLGVLTIVLAFQGLETPGNFAVTWLVLLAALVRSLFIEGQDFQLDFSPSSFAVAPAGLEAIDATGTVVTVGKDVSSTASKYHVATGAGANPSLMTSSSFMSAAMSPHSSPGSPAGAAALTRVPSVPGSTATLSALEVPVDVPASVKSD